MLNRLLLKASRRSGLCALTRVLKGTDGFYRYVDDGTSEEIECEWSEVPEDWRGKGDPDYTEEFREVAERELDGKERHMVLSALVKKG